jgi:hypothetical protein
MVKLFRGISVSSDRAEKILEEIRENGLAQSSEATWRFVWKEQKNRELLFLKEDLKKEDTAIASVKVKTRDGFYTEPTEGNSSICFADQAGAEYYAKKHNKEGSKIIPILIEAKLDLSQVAIDGRDFLYTAFHYLRSVPQDKQQKAKDALVSIFGKGIVRYIEKVFSHPKSDTNAICDLIICDDDVKISHSQNRYVINGRHGTHFKCAFFATVPILKENIINVSILDQDYICPPTDFSLSVFR